MSEEKNYTELPTTRETLLNCLNITDPSTGKVATAAARFAAWTLYSFYAGECVRGEETSQPLATDGYCSECMRCDIKTVRNARALLMAAGIIEHISKGKKGLRFVRVHHLTRKLTNYNAFALDETEIQMGNYDVFDHFSKWYDRAVSNYPVFEKRIHWKCKKRGLEVTGKLSQDKVLSFVTTIYRRMENGKQIMDGPPSEKRFVHYLVDSVINEFLNRKPKAKTYA